MKKISITLLILFSISIVLGFIFRENLIGAYRHQQLQEEFNSMYVHRDPPHYQLPTQGLKIISSTNTPLNVGNLSIPIEFEAEYFATNSVPYRASGEDKTIKVSPPTTDDILQIISADLQDDLDDEMSVPGRKDSCAVFTRAFGPDACENNYYLYKSLVELNAYKPSRLTPFKEQLTYYKLVILSEVMQDSPGTYSFQFENLSGIIFDFTKESSLSGLYFATLFTNNGEMYNLTFSGMSLEEVTNVIYSSTVTE